VVVVTSSLVVDIVGWVLVVMLVVIDTVDGLGVLVTSSLVVAAVDGIVDPVFGNSVVTLSVVKPVPILAVFF